VFLVTAPIAFAALLVVLALKEAPLRGPSGPPQSTEPDRHAQRRPAAVEATR
jgi:hypothetical protein